MASIPIPPNTTTSNAVSLFDPFASEVQSSGDRKDENPFDNYNNTAITTTAATNNDAQYNTQWAIHAPPSAPSLYKPGQNIIPQQQQLINICNPGEMMPPHPSANQQMTVHPQQNNQYAYNGPVSVSPPNWDDALDFISTDQKKSLPGDGLDFIASEVNNPPKESSPPLAIKAETLPVITSPLPVETLTVITSPPPAISSDVVTLPPKIQPRERRISSSQKSYRENQLGMHTLAISPPTPTHSSAVDTKIREIAENLATSDAPPGASHLPSPSQMINGGFILTRISFRTLLFKKWKQNYWMQYGPTTLLIFRNKVDADDWKNNPYHTVKEREFLIKMKIDFCEDAVNVPGCRGYQIKSIKRKGYGRKEEDLLEHFKLERHMDYGPTIAACFGSQTGREVESLRKVIIQLIKNSKEKLRIIRDEEIREAEMYAGGSRVNRSPDASHTVARGRYEYEDENSRVTAP